MSVGLFPRLRRQRTGQSFRPFRAANLPFAGFGLLLRRDIVQNLPSNVFADMRVQSRSALSTVSGNLATANHMENGVIGHRE